MQNKLNVFDLSKWKYYQNSIIPSTPPHDAPYLSKEGKKELFKKYKKALFIRWYSHFDCKEKTEWWYVIKDTSYDIQNLKAKRRYEITKARKFFEVKKISALEYKEALSYVNMEASKGYKKRDRNNITHEQIIKTFENWDKSSHLTIFAAFFKETSELCGYALIAKQGHAIHLSLLKTIPEFEKYSLNAALVDNILLEYDDLIKNGHYISDGSSNILHETRFQDYLEKYFGFRKAYCRLHISYRGIFKVFVKFLLLFKNIFKSLDHIRLFHKINGVLHMEMLIDK